MLGATLSLHDINDVEEFCRSVASQWCRKTEARLSRDAREDLHAYLVSTAWELSEFHYDPAKGRSFASYSYQLLQLRATDWLRRTEGRTRWQWSGGSYERPARLAPLSLEAANRPTDDDAGWRLVDTLRSQPSDDPDFALADGGGWLDSRDERQHRRDLALVRGEAHRLDEDRDRAANARRRKQRLKGPS